MQHRVESRTWIRLDRLYVCQEAKQYELQISEFLNAKGQIERGPRCKDPFSGVHCVYRTNLWIGSWYAHTKRITETILQYSKTSKENIEAVLGPSSTGRLGKQNQNPNIVVIFVELSIII
jgi:hypothetical protein